MNNLTVFNYQDKEVRTILKNNAPWFALKDTCAVLEIANSSDARTRLKKDGVGAAEVIDSLGRKQQITIINESNLYKLIFQSRKEEAEKFTDFVTSEILPSIRKTGSYTSKLSKDELETKKKNAEARFKNAQTRQADFILKAVDKYKETLSDPSISLMVINAVEIITGENTIPRPQLEERTWTATEIAKEFGTTANMVGRIANSNNLKIKEYGIEVLDKSLYSSKQVSSFRYNSNGKQKIKELLNV